MSAPVQFADFSKSITDIFDKSGFNADKKIKQTFKTPAVYGSPITVSQEISSIDDFSKKGYGGKISAKWKHACGFSIDKFDNSAAKGTVLETSFNKFPEIKNLGVAVKLNKSYGDDPKFVVPLEVNYSNEIVATSVQTVAPDFPSTTANLTLASEGLMVGTSLSFTKGSSAPEDYPISLSYAGKGFTGAVEATNKLRTFNLLGAYTATPNLSVAAKFLVPEADKKSAALAAVYSLGDSYGTKLAGMYSYTQGFEDKKKNKAAALECAVTAKPLKQVETGFALALPAATLTDTKTFKYGITLTLG